MQKDRVARILTLLLGVVFLFSGGMKGVDPFGTGLKIKAYANLFHWGWLENEAQACAILLCAFELFLGLMIISRLCLRAVLGTAIGMLIGFTVLTIYLVLPSGRGIGECGCFGDMVAMTNEESLAKNVILLIVACVSFRLTGVGGTPSVSHSPIKRLLSIGGLAVLGIFVPLYAMVYLPSIDSFGYRRGTNLIEREGFVVFNAGFKNVTDSLLSNDRHDLYAVVATDGLDAEDYQRLADLRRMARDGKVSLCLFSSHSIDRGDIPVYYVDEMTLKSMVRAPKGLVLLRRGVLVKKWNLSYY